MTRILLFILFSFVLSIGAYGQVSLQTIAEASGYESTSRYADVKGFIGELKKSSPFIRTENIGTSLEGREIPLMILANPMPLSPQDLNNDKRMVVYIQGNIHPGEVEGKEAILMFARDLLKERDPALLKDLVILLCPNLNPDGNEKISVNNRTNQSGPVNGVGVRYNSQYLDLNRDAMKLETNEIRGVVANVFNCWDPSVILDCHTTNGVYRQEPVTFSWMVNPNGDRNLVNYMRDRMMPEVSRILAENYQVENCFYGEFFDMMNPDSGYINYAGEPRYLVNYAGLRNRLAILNENYVYADFRTRVEGTYYLIHSVLQYAMNNTKEINQLLLEADKRLVNRSGIQGDVNSFALKYEARPAPEKITVKTYEVERYPGESGMWQRYRNTGIKKTVTIPYIADYYPTETLKVPDIYLITSPDPEVISNLVNHGIKMEVLKEDMTLRVERFEISDITPSTRLNQGHYTNTLKGQYIEDTVEFKAGTHLIRTAQALGNLAAYLLEPQSDDGYAFWNFFDKYLVPQWGDYYYPWPVYRVFGELGSEVTR